MAFWSRFHSLQRKIIMAIVMVGLLPLTLLLGLTYLEERRALRETTGTSFKEVAVDTARRIEMHVTRVMNEGQQLATTPFLRTAVSEANRTYEDKDPKRIQDMIKDWQQRWKQRDKEKTEYFESSKDALLGNRLKLAARTARNQGQVWRNVGYAQSMLTKNLKADVKDSKSESSLQLTLENKKLLETIDTYVKKLEGQLARHKDVIGYAVAMVAFAVGRDYAIAFGALIVIGVFDAFVSIIRNSIMQLAAPGGMRGRVMALYSVVLLGGTPIGAPIAGWTAERLGPRMGLALGGLVAVAVGLAAWRVVRRHGLAEPVPTA